MKTIKLEESFKRDTESISCPECKGYCDKVKSTEQEIKETQSCRRKFACCMATFVCKVCKARIVVHLEAPEMG